MPQPSSLSCGAKSGPIRENTLQAQEGGISRSPSLLGAPGLTAAVDTVKMH
jgi:hypothetical protein